jgi:predicted nucleotidyltransferase
MLSILRARLAPLLEGARFAYVFGSFGSPYFSEESDLDVAVDFGAALGPEAYLRLAMALSDAAGRNTDLLDLRRADPIIAMQVLKSGAVLLVNDPKALAAFQMVTLAAYADQKLDRRPVERDLRMAMGGLT